MKKETRPFHERFNIPLSDEEAKNRFMNRLELLIKRSDFYDNQHITSSSICTDITLELGRQTPYTVTAYIDEYLRCDFYECLHFLEVLYCCFSRDHRYNEYQKELSSIIEFVLNKSEIDFGINWEDGKFIRSGAALMDQKLVNELLLWLSNPEYENVYNPFVKGLNHLLRAEKQPELLSDVVTDMYESLEALTKIVTGRHNKDLSGNAELFIRKIKVSHEYKKILKAYIDYGNLFRHSPKEKGRKKPKISMYEAENFVYLTGAFIRLGIKGSKNG